ncbi:hypothetical protein [Flavicella sediminum]|uniref:hypothetical protein n=1 Tax=Flavicella sediminum TaxID=2585141 RepID=UPI00111DDECA|nr:hypothetical protein [Flavicella sediminum]
MNHKPIVFFVVVLLSMAQLISQNLGKSKPNILFIMSDDHTSQAVGVYGSRLAKFDRTLNIDRIGKEELKTIKI